MNHHYNDIRSRIAEPPRWYDENATPRYCAFSPDETANIYADEVAFFRIACQNCGCTFDVCMSWTTFQGVIQRVQRLSEQIEARAIHYGDPPNVSCCPAGPTMNSIPLRVLEFWRRAPITPDGPDWERVPALEVVLPDWAGEP